MGSQDINMYILLRLSAATYRKSLPLNEVNIQNKLRKEIRKKQCLDIGP